MSTQPQSTSLDKTSVLLNAGNAFYQMGDKHQSLFLYKLAEEEDCLDESVVIRLMSYYLSEKQIPEADKQALRLFSIIPNTEKKAECYNLLATLYRLKKMPDLSIGYCEDSVRLAPELPDYHSGMAHTLHCLGRHQDALVESGAAVMAAEASPLPYNKHMLRVNMGLDQMLLGDYTNGLKNYEFRRDFYVRPLTTIKEVACKEDFDKYDILLVAEQGYGDVIMMSRFAKFLASRCVSVGVLCDPNIAPLMNYVDGVEYVFTSEDQIVVKEPWRSIPMFSILQYFEMGNWESDQYINIPTSIAELVDMPDFHIGLCWRGNKSHQNDFIRSINYKDFTVFDDLPMWSVQYGATQEELDYVTGWKGIDPSSSILKQACAISRCKCVLTVDTMTSHLAGALGVPCIQLTAMFPDWRWGADGDTTMWYPKHKIIRQRDGIATWYSALDEARKELDLLVKS